jgi:hypothetical protein
MTEHEVNLQSAGEQWPPISPNIRDAITAGWGWGMPPLASAVHARWWQIETWLRSLIYVEFRAAYGSKWADELSPQSDRFQGQDSKFRYMATPDAQNRLAYMDTGHVFDTLENRWDLFEGSLMAREVWKGRVAELAAIRRRMGHCRRPHSDDLLRLEQSLRDLNAGAFAALSSFNEQWHAKENWSDAVVDGWCRGNHETAIRLIEHAERQYETTFELRCSRRPWKRGPSPQDTISGVDGYIWHALWYFRGVRPFALDQFWRRIEPLSGPILFVCADTPSSISISFSALEDAVTVSDVIGHCFDSALMSWGHGPNNEPLDQWQARFAELDPKVQVFSPWGQVDSSMWPTSIFSA